jgi:hypothetical protein
MRKGNSVERAVGRNVVVGRDGGEPTQSQQGNGRMGLARQEGGDPTQSQQGNSRMGLARQDGALNRPRRTGEDYFFDYGHKEFVV